MGKPIKIRAKVKGDISEVKALMPHDMESGLRRDADTNELVPAHYITELAAEHKGEIVMTAYLGPAVSRNPYASFSFTCGVAGDTFKFHSEDNLGVPSTTEAVLK